MILEGLGTEEQERRFWAKVGAPTAAGCLEWAGARDPNGYGRFGIGVRSTLAHRVAYWLTTGEDPGQWVVMHTCDNPPCVNPRHLRLGTHGTNVADKVAKGRYVRPAEKLNDIQVEAIRQAIAAGVRYADIARQYDIALATITKIKQRRRITTIERARSKA